MVMETDGARNEEWRWCNGCKDVMVGPVLCWGACEMNVVFFYFLGACIFRFL